MLLLSTFCAIVAACGGGGGGSSSIAVPSHQQSPTPFPSPSISPTPFPSPGVVAHIIIIMMENRSFDSYFGTFPGVNGIPAKPNCNPDPQANTCVLPYHDASPYSNGGPHAVNAMPIDIDNGKFDGFIESVEKNMPADPSPDDVMGYHTCDDIPVYCQYASQYTLADNHFAATNSWSAMAHLYLVSGWSAECKTSDPMSCESSNNYDPADPNFAWTDLTWLLYMHGISWGYYLNGSGFGSAGPRFDPADGEEPSSAPTGPQQPGVWNPLPGFLDVRVDGQLGDIQPGANFLTAAAAGRLPAVSWVIPDFSHSDHPPASILAGQSWVQSQVDAVMNGPDGPNSLILLTWDEWGGFYDHVQPPVIDFGGYGFRTPLILIGSMVKHGYIDHQLLTSDAYMKLIEDVFMGSARLDPNTDGRPDSRPDVRENVAGLGDLRNDLVTP